MRVPLEVEEAVEFDNGNVIVEIAGVEVRVDGDGQDVQLNVGVELTVIVHVPFSQSDLVVEKMIEILFSIRNKMWNSP